MAAPSTDNGSKQQVETAAIVLDCRDHGKSDKIITFFCEKLGRITGIAKGAKHSKKRFVNKPELFSSLRITHTLPQNGRLAIMDAATNPSAITNLPTMLNRHISVVMT